MKFRIAVGAVSLVVLVACGSSDTYTLSTGTYPFSSSMAVAPDDCNLGSLYPSTWDKLQISVAGSNATFAFNGVFDPSRNPVTPINGNSLSVGSKTYDLDNRPTYDCIETITVSVDGNLIANDQVQGTLRDGSIKKTGFTGAGCTAANLGYRVYPQAGCSSSLSFTAKKR